jgi:aspartyl-tRNA(Asn)/glutamyl-tRNA(Gln) amidotransferase subunit A
MPDLCFLSLAEAARRVREGALSPSDLVDAHLDRIAKVDSKLHAYITVTADIARQQAAEAKATRRNGALQGIPISYKDLIATAGIRTTAASRIYADWIPEKDAHAVSQMRRSGAITLGKATLNEFAFSPTTEQDFVTPARNPWDLSLSAGLSSSGSAAGVAAGLAMASIATDSGGSIRIPASFCGVTGIKPTYGLVGRTGVIPLSYSCDHVGILARSAEDIAIVLTALAGHDPEDPASSAQPARDYTHGHTGGIRSLRFGVPSRYMDAVGIDTEVLAAYQEALKVIRSLGGSVREVEIEYLTYGSAADFTILRVEGFSVHQTTLRSKHELYGVGCFRQIAAGGYLSGADYYRALQARSLISNSVAKAFESMDVLVTPTTPQTAARGAFLKSSQDPKVARSGVAFLAPFNLTGSPAISVPCGFNNAHLPIGLQFIGRAFTEETILRSARAYQDVTEWHVQRPNL